jgi:multidrug efflux system outer membrane protein
VPTGVPSALLVRRPDIAQAEQQLIAANANIGVARAAYFPQISLTGAAGWQSTALSALFSGPAGFWTAGAALAQPIFNAGRTRSRVELATAQREEATLVYQQTIQQALRDVSDALVAYRKGRTFVSRRNCSRDPRAMRGGWPICVQGGANELLWCLTATAGCSRPSSPRRRAAERTLLALVQICRSLGGAGRCTT